MVEKFRSEFEEHIEMRRREAEQPPAEDVIPIGVADQHSGPQPVH